MTLKSVGLCPACNLWFFFSSVTLDVLKHELVTHCFFKFISFHIRRSKSAQSSTRTVVLQHSRKGLLSLGEYKVQISKKQRNKETRKQRNKETKKQKQKQKIKRHKVTILEHEFIFQFGSQGFVTSLKSTKMYLWQMGLLWLFWLFFP